MKIDVENLTEADFKLVADIRNSIVENPKLDQKAKMRVLHKLRDFAEGRTQDLVVHEDGLDLSLKGMPGKKKAKMRVLSLVQEVDRLDERVAIFTELLEWIDGGLKLERPVGSATHKLREAWIERRVVLAPGIVGDEQPDPGDLVGDPQIFVVEHDWHGAMKRAADFSGGEWHFPYDDTAFEFRISGKRVVALYTHMETRGMVCWPFVETTYGWVLPEFTYLVGADAWAAIVPVEWKDPPKFAPLLAIIANQTRAICIALEAEAATTETVRAPYKLNAARERKGKLPIFDYHVVKLNHRSRPSALPADHVPGERRSPRLHLVRGHWKHYQNHKTWTKWFFRGNPDLGFIDKEYRL